MADDRIQVTITNLDGEKRTLCFDNTERGQELAKYLKSLQRREELDSVTIKEPGRRSVKGETPASTPTGE